MLDIRNATSHPTMHKHQRGAVLFISLIMLLLLTLIGITAMQVTLLQERMAGGFRIQHQAFEWTEGKLKDTRTLLNADANSSGPLYYSADAALTVANGARTLKYFVVSALDQDGVIQNDPNGGDAKAAVQAVFIY
jgi:type IV pilus assembly protein PilX